MTLGEFYNQKMRVQEDVNAGQILELSVALNIDIKQARYMFRHYGKGYIYLKSGLAFVDSPRNKSVLTKKYGECVVVSQYGKIYTIEPQDEPKAKPRISQTEVNERIRQYQLYKMAEKETGKMFHDGQGKSTRKHGGKGDSMDLIGFYKDVPPATLYGMAYKQKRTRIRTNKQ